MKADNLRDDTADPANENHQQSVKKQALSRLVDRLRRTLLTGPVELASGNVIATDPCLHHRVMSYIARIKPPGGTVVIEGHSNPLSQILLREGTVQ